MLAQTHTQCSTGISLWKWSHEIKMFNGRLLFTVAGVVLECIQQFQLGTVPTAGVGGGGVPPAPPSNTHIKDPPPLLRGRLM